MPSFWILFFNAGRNESLSRTKSTLHLHKASNNSLRSKMINGSTFSNETNISRSLSSVCSPLATEPKIPSSLIPNYGPNSFLNLDNISLYSATDFINISLLQTLEIKSISTMALIPHFFNYQ